MSVVHATCPRLAVTEMNACLPRDESAYEAKDSQECQAIVMASGMRPNPSAVAAIQSLTAIAPVDQQVLQLTEFALFLVIMGKSTLATAVFRDLHLTFTISLTSHDIHRKSSNDRRLGIKAI